ncbi:MAG: hypothetical protein A3A58_01870 [Candidatus Blackburnbacteria bacterium RIFCSPLOWO2_01_FULL_41_27]|uniref:Peptidase M50 domain-containing protein n=1 Tax=Candidatus Blackburnbacteria bacterium RIFCSPLOWO2_01_FULL_41_27 TaxID=1797520 RepID=A0A1G1VGG1_9BACT|nr:MAG: hypothetical protein A3A58_01870 [Candidatus Blackburnbacteria bacterium RIFCSPLOWO2_01_FULL_41_27]
MFDLSQPTFLFQIIAFLLALTFHEFAHALAADRLGDPTPRVQGRLTLNPIAHIDLFGTILLPLFLLLTRAPILFGWAKPVMFDPYNLANPRRDAAIISFAGPLANLILAIASALLLSTSRFYDLGGSLTFDFLYQFITLNIVLAIFNLVPVHPLDGGKILVGLLPEDVADQWDRILRQYGTFILLFLIFPIFGGQAIVWNIIGPTISFILGILLPTGGLI